MLDGKVPAYKVSFITVNFNNYFGLEKTLKKLIELKNLADHHTIELILIDGFSGKKDIDVIEKYRNFLDIVIIEKDSGIYDAMNKGINLASGFYLNFMNSGDIPVVHNMKKFIDKMDDKKSIFYGNGLWTERVSGLFINKISSFWMKMPNHQAMFIPLEYHKNNLYDETFPIAADLQFKLKAYKELNFFHHNIDIVLSEPGGASQTIKSFKDLLNRANEIRLIALINNGYIASYINYIKFIVWHSRRLIFK